MLPFSPSADEFRAILTKAVEKRIPTAAACDVMQDAILCPQDVRKLERWGANYNARHPPCRLLYAGSGNSSSCAPEGEDSCIEKGAPPAVKMPVVFIVSGEWDLRGAVRAELREAGIEALGLETVDDMAQMIAGGIAPGLVVLDGEQLRRPEARHALENLSSRLPVLVVDSRLSPAPPLPGAKTILRPVQVKEIVARVVGMLSSPSS